MLSVQRVREFCSTLRFRLVLWITLVVFVMVVVTNITVREVEQQALRQSYDQFLRDSLEDVNVAVCVLPGTELSFAYEVRRSRLWPWSKNILHHKTAIFRQVNIDCPHAHHDALEFPDGEIVLLTYLMEGQQATVLQLPAAAVGSKAPERAVYAPPGLNAALWLESPLAAGGTSLPRR